MKGKYFMENVNGNLKCKAFIAAVGVLIAVCGCMVVNTTSAHAADTNITMYRLYNKYSGEHLFTADTNEKNVLPTKGWKYEGTGWTAPKTSNTPVYRLYNPNSGDHHYTTDKNEYNTLKKIGWRQEDISFYSASSTGVATYRLFNPNVKVGTHHYTTDKNEYDTLCKRGWRGEGKAWYGITSGVPDTTSSSTSTSSGSGSTIKKPTAQSSASEVAAYYATPTFDLGGGLFVVPASEIVPGTATLWATDPSKINTDNEFVKGMLTNEVYKTNVTYTFKNAPTLNLGAYYFDEQGHMILNSNIAGDYCPDGTKHAIDAIYAKTTTGDKYYITGICRKCRTWNSNATDVKDIKSCQYTVEHWNETDERISSDTGTDWSKLNLPACIYNYL